MIKTIALEMKKSTVTITKYLKSGKGLGWCDYDGRGSFRCVECVNTGEKFKSILDAGEKYGVKRSSISACCRGFNKTGGKDKNGVGLVWRYC